MKRTTSLCAALAVLLCVALFAAFGGKNAHAANTRVLLKRASPAATVTPRQDNFGLGLPQPSVAPTCVTGRYTIFSDPDGKAMYACRNGALVIVNGAAGANFATPTATITATPTPTITATP